MSGFFGGDSDSDDGEAKIKRMMADHEQQSQLNSSTTDSQLNEPSKQTYNEICDDMALSTRQKEKRRLAQEREKNKKQKTAEEIEAIKLAQRKKKETKKEPKIKEKLVGRARGKHAHRDEVEPEYKPESTFKQQSKPLQAHNQYGSFSGEFEESKSQGTSGTTPATLTHFSSNEELKKFYLEKMEE